MPVERGRPTAFVSVTDVGVPRAGATSVGELASTTAPVPVAAPLVMDVIWPCALTEKLGTV